MTIRKGVDNIRSKLTEDEVLTIYNDTESTQHELANRFGISQSAVNHIRKGRTWEWLTKHQK